MRPENTNMSALAMLAARMAKPAQQSPPAKPDPSPTGFVPGVPGEPLGPRGTAVVKDHPDKISGVLAELKAQNPDRKIKAPAFVEAWNARHPDLPLNLSRGRTVLARTQAAEERQQMAALEERIMRGALSATKLG